jgi:hypothetical protein
MGRRSLDQLLVQAISPISQDRRYRQVSPSAIISSGKSFCGAQLSIPIACTEFIRGLIQRSADSEAMVDKTASLVNAVQHTGWREHYMSLYLSEMETRSVSYHFPHRC